MNWRFYFLVIVLFIFVSKTFAQGEAEIITTDTTTFVKDSLILDAATRILHDRTLLKYDKDSLALLEYNHSGEIIGLFPGISLYSLGNFGQPAWASLFGSSPMQYAILYNGQSIDDLQTNRTDLYDISTEDISTVIVYPMHQAFFYGGCGKLLAGEFTEKEWDSPNPYTRIRHTEAPYDYLYTDVIFNMNPGERNNLHLGITRRTIGTTKTDNPARFKNNRSEEWNLRTEYRHHVSNRSTIFITNQYSDQLRYLNSGIPGWLNSDEQPFHFYPTKNSTGFLDSASNPILASYINPTIRAKDLLNVTKTNTIINWLNDSSHVSKLGGSFLLSEKTYSDKINENLPDTIQRDKLEYTNSWKKYNIFLEHDMLLSLAEFSMSGILSYFDLKAIGITEHTEGFLFNARSKLTFTLPATRVTFFGRSEYQYGQTAFGGGTTIQFAPDKDFIIWTGASFSLRPYSLFERYFSSSYSENIGERPSKLERLYVVECGSNYTGSSFEGDVRLFYRNTDSYQYISVAPLPDSLPTGYTRFKTLFINAPFSAQTGGISAFGRIHLWRFVAESRVDLTSSVFSEQMFEAPLSPELSTLSSLFFRGPLISETLDIKLGGSIAYASSYFPTIYNPQTDWFGYPEPVTIEKSMAKSYTGLFRVDFFLFAKIKESVTIFLLLHNAFDSRYITTQFYPMYDRSFRFGVDWIFLD